MVISQSKQTRGLVAAATAAISSDRRREKENMSDFISKKREMFLVQVNHLFDGYFFNLKLIL